jgi:hypothetical protein
LARFLLIFFNFGCGCIKHMLSRGIPCSIIGCFSQMEASCFGICFEGEETAEQVSD